MTKHPANPVVDRQFPNKAVCQTCGRRLGRRALRWFHTRWFGLA